MLRKLKNSFIVYTIIGCRKNKQGDAKLPHFASNYSIIRKTN